MAEDTRQPDSSPSETSLDPEQPRLRRRPKPKHDFPKTQAGKMWDALYDPQNNPNSLPGGMANSAGGMPPEVTWRDAFKFRRKDGPSFYQAPCARDSLLVGIGAGGAVGGVRFILKGLSSMIATSNWAVGGFVVGSLGMYQWCESRRREEQKGMMAAVRGMEMLKEKKAKEQAIAEAAKRAAESERQKDKPWYSVW